ncbi:MAG: endonuclease MutS2, partial [Hydrogenimonas sp.]|nr:endonuclease MutS2 [Hydrogenimonas sp.]
MAFEESRGAERDLQIADRLDLSGYLELFSELFARPKPLYMEGDRGLHYRFIRSLDGIDLKAPPKVDRLDSLWIRLSKQGVPTLEEIYEVAKIVRYFRYLKGLKIEGVLGEWLDEIEIPAEVEEIASMFDDKGELQDSVDERIASLKRALEQNRDSIKGTLSRIVASSGLSPYLVDRQIHYVNGEEVLLLRGGFSQVLKGSIVGRTSAGFFYVLPDAVSKLKDKEASIAGRLEELYYEIAKSTGLKMSQWLKFFRFIDRAFDRFDHYQARVAMAKMKDLSFILPDRSGGITLKGFSHPALTHPKPVDIAFDRDVLMITGVNAGGKTMLLKSILASAWLAKHLLPMKCNPHGTKIGSFTDIVAIIEDPQNVKNDISTFAGRMREFSRLFGKKGLLVGVDEIELGTDSDEAASLFKVIIEELIKRKIKIVVTTHHKRLAAMMAADERVELVAAVYDERNQTPTYTFLQGIIGKSYAFETAQRYGVPKNIVERARVEYGEDKERLNELIERSSTLEKELRQKREALEKELLSLKREKERYKELSSSLERELLKRKRELEAIYEEATKEAREALKQKDERSMHRQLNRAHKIAKKAKV